MKKIVEYMRVLITYGTRVGEPYVKHIEGKIWEMRPTNDRILFFAVEGGIFIMLHHFVKKTQKTPPRETEQARRNMVDFLKRRPKDE